MRRVRVVSGSIAAITVAAALGLAACGQSSQAPDGASPEESAPSASAARAVGEDLGAPASPEVRALYTGEFQAFGVLSGVGSGEGAWELQLSDQFVQLLRPGLQDVVSYQVDRGFFAQGMRASAGPLTVTIKRQECPIPNGGSLEYTTSVVFEDVAYEGCARRGIAAPGDEVTWAVAVEELLPAIDACLAEVRSPPARVTMASLMPPDNDGVTLVSVRLREADRQRRDCFVTADGSAVREIEPIGDGDTRSGEGDPEFVRTPGPEPRGDNCRSVTPVVDAASVTLGWLIRRTC